MNKMKVIFTDFDGVINGSGRFLGFIMKTNIITPEFYWYLVKKNIIPEIYGVHKSKIKRLAKICKATGAKLVITSSWRKAVWQYYIDRSSKPITDDVKKVVELFDKYNIEVIDITERSLDSSREKEIITWLSKHEDEIENFVILDDEWSDLMVFYDRNINNSDLIITSDSRPNNPIHGYWYCRDGLRNCHVKIAIKKLNSKKGDTK